MKPIEMALLWFDTLPSPEEYCLYKIDYNMFFHLKNVILGVFYLLGNMVSRSHHLFLRWTMYRHEKESAATCFAGCIAIRIWKNLVAETNLLRLRGNAVSSGLCQDNRRSSEL